MCTGGEPVFVALGSNLGDRAAHLSAARAALAALPGSRLLACSDVEETDPLGPPGQGRYLNQIVAIQTSLEPLALLDLLLAIERAEGRVRGERWTARTLDLDIVLFGDRRLVDARLVVPHPELPNRDFWRRELEQVEQRLATPSHGTR